MGRVIWGVRPRLAAGWGKVAIALCVAVLLLAGAVSVGLRLPGLRFLDGFGSGRGPDYSARSRGTYAPLSDAYLARVLGPIGLGLPLAGRGATAGPAGTPATRASHTGEASRVVLAHPFTNDNFERAITVPSVPFTATTDTASASREPGEPQACGVAGGSVWYAYTPARDVNLAADTFGTSYADALAVYQGDRLTGLETVACSSSVTGNSQLGFLAKAGTTYAFQISGAVGGGSLVFDVAPVGATTRANVSSKGVEADTASADPANLSADGRFAVFYSAAKNLGDTCTSMACAGIYVRDRQTGITSTIVSFPRQPAGSPSGGGSYVNGPDLWAPDISDDGRFVVFHTDAPNLVPGDNNGDYDVFVYDRQTKTLERASVSSTGAESHAPAIDPQRLPYSPGEFNFPGAKFGAISADGRFVVFTSNATDLGDGNPGVDQVYVHDRTTGRTERVSFGPSGEPLAVAQTKFGQTISADGRFVTYLAWTQPPAYYGHAPGQQVAQVYVYDRTLHRSTIASRSASGQVGDGDSYNPALSADGSHVAFTSEATNLVPDDTNGTACAHAGVDTCGVDYFSFDLRTGALVRVSVNSEGQQQETVNAEGGISNSLFLQPIPTISGDGRFVAFPAFATNLAPGDTSPKEQVYLHDSVTGSTVRVSVSSTGAAANDDAYAPVLSTDGSRLSFISKADNLVTGDTNQAEDIFVHEL